MNKRLKEEVLKLFGIESDESELAGLVILQAIFFGFQNLFTRTAVFAIFLETFTAAELPYLYIATGILVPILGAAFAWYQARTNNLKAYAVSLNLVLLLLLSMVASTQLLEAAPIAVFLLPVLYLAVFRFLELVLAGTKNTVFTLRQTKRLSGLISTGSKLSMFVGGLLVPLILYAVSIEWLIFISVFMIAGAKFNQTRILKAAVIENKASSSQKSEAPAGVVPGSSEDETEQATYRIYTLWILAIQAGLSAMYFAVDNAFLAEVKQHFSTAEEVGSFLGYISAAAALLSIVIGSISGKLLVSRFGTIDLVRLTPTFVGSLALVALVVSAWIPESILVLGCFAVIRVGERALTPTVFYPSYDSLFQSLPPDQGARAQSFSLTFSGPIAGAFIGVLLLVLGALFQVSAVHLSLLIALVAGVMLLACGALVAPYRKSLEYAVRSRRIERLSVSLSDETSLLMLEKSLSTERAEDVNYAFELLIENAPERAFKHHQTLISHPNMMVRAYMVKRFELMNYENPAHKLIDLLKEEAAPTVQSEILWSLAQTGADEAHDILAPYLYSKHQRLLKTVVAAMVKHGSLHDIISAGVRLEELQSSSKPEERQLAAEIIGRIGNPAFYHGLKLLLNDSELMVRQAAVNAAGILASPRLLPFVLERLEEPPLLSSVFKALKQFGEEANEALWNILGSSEHPIYLKRQLIELLVYRPTPDTKRRLITELRTEDLDHLQLYLCGLQLLGQAADDDEIGALSALVEREGERAIDLLEAIERYSEVTMDGGVQLRETLDEEFQHLVERVLLIACIVIPGLPFRKISQSVFLKQNKDIAFFCELLEERLPIQMASRIVPLLEPLERHRRIDKLCKLYNRAPKDALTQLTEISRGSFTVHNPWLAICAERFLAELKGKPSATLEAPNDDATLVSRVECLRELEFFAHFPSSVVAQCLKYFVVTTVNPGEVVREEGVGQRALYVVESGGVELDGERLGRGVSFGLETLLGEALSGEKVVAAEPSRILSLDRDVFLLMLKDSFLVYQVVLKSLAKSIEGLLHGRDGSKDEIKRPAQDVSSRDLIQQRLILNGTTLFGTLPPTELEHIVAHSEVLTFEPETTVAEASEVVNDLYYVIAGSLVLGSTEAPLARLSAGDHFGKLGHLGYEVALGSALVVESDATLLRIDGDAVDELSWMTGATIWATLCHISELKNRYARRLEEFTWF